MTPQEYEEYQRLGILPKPQVEQPIQQPTPLTRMQKIQRYFGRIRERQQPIRQQSNLLNPQRKPVLTQENIRKNIRATNLLSGYAWNDRSNKGRLSLMDTDRRNQLEIQRDIQNQKMQEQMEQMQQQQQQQQQIQTTSNQEMPRRSILNASSMNGGIIGFGKARVHAPEILPQIR